MNTLRKVCNIAQEVREWAENLAGARENLCGSCAIASAELFKRLQAQGIAAEIRVSDDWAASHVFLVVDDHVVDVTATQFSQFADTPVVILHECEAVQHWFYEASAYFHSVGELRDYQTRFKWPQNQIARR